MIDLLAYFTNINNLLIVIPSFMILVIGVLLTIYYLRSPEVKRARKQIEDKKELPVVKEDVKIDFEAELGTLYGIKDPTKAFIKLSALMNSFFVKLFQMKDVVTYDEIKKDAKIYGFIEVITLCDMMSHLNFTRDEYKAEDFNKVAAEFKKIINSYGHHIHDDSKNKKSPFSELYESIGEISKPLEVVKEKFASWRLSISPPEKSFNKVWVKLSPAVEQARVKQLEKYLLDKHGHLFSYNINEVSGLEDVSKDIRHLIKVGREEIKKGDNLSASAIYNSVVGIFNNLPPSEREPLSDSVNELYVNVVNLIGTKACSEIMGSIKSYVASAQPHKAAQEYHHLNYIYDRLYPEWSAQVHVQWAAYVKVLLGSKDASKTMFLNEKGWEYARA